MQKALFIALLVGSFLFPRYVTAQDTQLDYSCPDGGTYQLHPELGHICSVPAPSSSAARVFKKDNSFVEGPWPGIAQVAIESYNETISYSGTTVTDSVISSDVPATPQPFPIMVRRTISDGLNPPTISNNPYTITANSIPPQHYCPPDSSPGLNSLGGSSPNFICWGHASLLNDCPEENGDCEPPPEECPPGTIGGCAPPEPDCFLTGSGSEVCFEDPEDKCDVNFVNDEPVYSNCQAGCGFVNENFLCAEEPELPSLDDCLVTTNGYACAPDVPEPDDNITDPNKPMPDMVKGDFKDTMRGVESRIDANNELLADQIKRDKDNTNLLAGKLDKTNQLLTGIDGNTKQIADALTGDELEIPDPTVESIRHGLGITGDETFSDLEKSVVDLGSYRDQFSWSVGPSTCPAPRNMNMLGKTFTLDWQPYCDAFTVVGYFVQAAAFLISGFIAFGVRK